MDHIYLLIKGLSGGERERGKYREIEIHSPVTPATASSLVVTAGDLRGTCDSVIISILFIFFYFRRKLPLTEEEKNKNF